MNHLPTYFTSKAIIAYFSVLMICAWLFVPRFLPFIWILFGAIEVFTFFYFTSMLTDRWKNIRENTFVKKIFTNALIFRLIYVVISYFFYQANTGTPFEFNAGDSKGYHGEGVYITWLFEIGALDYYFKEYIGGISDSGWPLVLAFIYTFSFKSIIVARIINALVSAWMVVLIFRIGKRNFGNEAARISAIMAMLLPTFIFYTGLHLKETFMIFLLMSFIDRADFLIHSRDLALKNILGLIFLGISLFFFRTVLAVAAWFALITGFLFSSEKLMTNYRKVVIVAYLLVASVFVFSGTIMKEISGYIGMRKTNQEQKYEHFSTRAGANQLAKYGNAAIFIPIIIPAPFPTLVNIPNQDNTMMINGDLFTRNIYVYFVFVAFYVLFKNKKLKQNLLLSVFMFSYLLILANSGYALSPRFHVPVLPFFILFAGFGITKVNKVFASYYFLYIVGISVLVIAWNWFKLAGRGLV